MSAKFWMRLIALLATAGLVAAACGGGDDSEGTAADTGDSTAVDSGSGDAAESDDGADPGGDSAEEIFGSSDDDSGDDPGSGDAGSDDTGADGSSDDAADEPEPEVEICDTATPSDVEIGVSADEITVLIAADVNTPLAPGLFQDAFDGLEAWAEHVNATGGLACRQVKVEQFDTLLAATESVNAQISACENALAMVGTTALFVFDVTPLNTCSDVNGDPIGLPDIAALTTEITHQCSANTYTILPPQGECPYEGPGERLHRERLGHVLWFQENITPNLIGVFLIPADLPSTRQTGVTTVRAAVDELGVADAGSYAISGFDLQPVYAEFVQAIADSGANYARTGSDMVSLVKFRSEALAQGVDVDIWECTISCYNTALFEIGGGVEDGTYLTVYSVPFEEADTNEELQAYVDGVADPAAFGMNAWASGVLLEEAINRIIESTGDINAITRANVLETLNGIDSFDANGMLGAVNPRDGFGSECFVLLQIQDQEFVRIYPEERGTLDCDSRNAVEITLDAAEAANSIE